jgi:iron(III) transport system permease protein
MIKKITQNKKSKKKWIRGIITGLLLWILTGYILYPVLKTFEVSLIKDGVITLSHYMDFFNMSAYRMSLFNSVSLGLLTVVVCGLIGTALAFFVHFFDLPFGRVLDKLLLLPVVLPGLIIVFAFVQLYGESGLVTKTLELIFGLKEAPYVFSGLSGILFVHAYTQYVYFYMNVSIAIRHIDRYAIEAARNLGASNRQVLITVIFPFIKPALLASSVMTFMTGIGSFSAPSIIGGSYKVLTTQILLSKANNYMDVAATQVIILMGVSTMYLVLSRYYENRVKYIPSVRGVGIKPIRIQNTLLRGSVLVLTGMLAITILLPIVAIFVLSFVKPGTWMIEIYPKAFSLDNYIRIFTKSRSLAPFMNSLVMASIAAFFCMVVAIPAAYLTVKTDSRFKVLVEGLVMLPWALPSSAIAVNMINAFNHPSVFTGRKILVGGFILLPIAYFVSLLPLMFRTSVISLQNLNDVYIEASKSLRGGPVQTFRRIILPIVAPGMMGGTLLVIIRSIGEYTISAFLYTAGNKPVSIAMVNSIFDYKIGLAMAYGALVVAFTLVVSLIIGKIPRI